MALNFCWCIQLLWIRRISPFAIYLLYTLLVTCDYTLLTSRWISVLNFIMNWTATYFNAGWLKNPSILQYKLRQTKSQCSVVRTATTMRARDLKNYGQIPGLAKIYIFTPKRWDTAEAHTVSCSDSTRGLSRDGKCRGAKTSTDLHQAPRVRII